MSISFKTTDLNSAIQSLQTPHKTLPCGDINLLNCNEGGHQRIKGVTININSVLVDASIAEPSLAANAKQIEQRLKDGCISKIGSSIIILPYDKFRVYVAAGLIESSPKLDAHLGKANKGKKLINKQAFETFRHLYNAAAEGLSLSDIEFLSEDKELEDQTHITITSLSRDLAITKPEGMNTLEITIPKNADDGQATKALADAWHHAVQHVGQEGIVIINDQRHNRHIELSITPAPAPTGTGD